MRVTLATASERSVLHEMAAARRSVRHINPASSRMWGVECHCARDPAGAVLRSVEITPEDLRFSFDGGKITLRVTVDSERAIDAVTAERSLLNSPKPERSSILSCLSLAGRMCIRHRSMCQPTRAPMDSRFITGLPSSQQMSRASNPTGSSARSASRLQTLRGCHRCLSTRDTTRRLILRQDPERSAHAIGLISCVCRRVLQSARCCTFRAPRRRAFMPKAAGDTGECFGG